jgi:hypothetical protein
MIALLKAFDSAGGVCHSDVRDYPAMSLIWEHVGCQQNNPKTVRVRVQTAGPEVEYRVEFSRWTPARRYVPSRRFRALVRAWADKVQ